MKCRGKETTTLTFVVTAFVLVCVCFVLNFIAHHLCGVFECAGDGVNLISLTSFGAAVASVLGLWQVREGIEKTKEYKENKNNKQGGA